MLDALGCVSRSLFNEDLTRVWMSHYRRIRQHFGWRSVSPVQRGAYYLPGLPHFPSSLMTRSWVDARLLGRG
jgi:hypothetical protein